LGVIARREGDDALGPFLGRELQKPIGGAAQLEGMPGLKTLAFQPDSIPPNLAFDERRVLDEVADPRRRFDDVCPVDKRCFS
jgi:hypothetical protein